MKKIGILFAFVAMAAFVVTGLVAGSVLAAGTDTADLSLSAKSDTDILQNGKVQVGISMDSFTIVNGVGYDGWQARLNYSSSLNVQSVEFLGGPGENPLGIREWKDDKANTNVLIGANNLPGEDGSNFKGQLVVVTFVCNAVDKFAFVEMKDPALVITHADKDIDAIVSPSTVGIDCRQAGGTGPGDTDGDGCSDQRESGQDETLGGQRDYENAYDFYDVTGGGGPPDRIIDLSNDILGVIQHYAPTGTEPEYDVNFDRGPSTGPNAWNMTAPDGVIDLSNDILGVVQQYQHNCR